MNSAVRRITRTFIAGLLAALPLAATLLILVWAVRLLVQWLGPESLIGRFLVAIGIGTTGSVVVGYLIGIGVLLAGIFALGMVVRSRMRRVLALAVNNVVQRIPVVGTVYDLVKKFVDLLAQKDAAGAKSMSPVWLHFGGPGGAGGVDAHGRIAEGIERRRASLQAATASQLPPETTWGGSPRTGRPRPSSSPVWRASASPSLMTRTT